MLQHGLPVLKSCVGTEGCAVQLRVLQVRSGQVRTVQLRVPQGCTVQVRVPQVRVVQLRVGQGRAGFQVIPAVAMRAAGIVQDGTNDGPICLLITRADLSNRNHTNWYTETQH